MASLESSAHVATVASSLAAAVALIWNVYVFRDTSVQNEAVLNAAIERQNETLATQLYQNYLELALQYPNYAFDEVDILKLSEEEGKKYLLFASTTLIIAERIHELQHPNKKTDVIVKSILRNHTFFINHDCEEIDSKFLDYLSKTIPGIQCT